MSFSFFWRHAGLISISFYACKREWTLHLAVSPKNWQWGYAEDWYDGPLSRFGLGPLFLLCWFYWDREREQHGD